MLEGIDTVDSHKRRLEMVREVIRDRQETNPSEAYYLSFSLQLARPMRNVSSSEMLSTLEKLQSAFARFAGDEEFAVKIMFGVSVPAHDEFIAEAVRRDQASQAIKENTPKLVAPGK